MPSTHQRDHALIAEAITESWLASGRLLVHLAREHGFTVEDVDNTGLAVLIVMHDGGHDGTPCFGDAEAALPEEGLKEGLRMLREPRDSKSEPTIRPRAVRKRSGGRSQTPNGGES